MRSVFVLMVWLLFVSVANAGLIDLSVNGSPAPDTIVMTPSQAITLDIMMNAPEFAGGDIAIVLSNAQGALDYSGITFKDPVMTRIYLPFPFPGWNDIETNWEAPWSVSPASNPQYLKIWGGNFNWNTVGPYVLMDDVVYHCEEATDLFIDLVAVTDVMYWQYDSTGGKLPDWGILAIEDSILDSFHVTQIPEPATLMLLGLGAALLKKQRRKQQLRFASQKSPQEQCLRPFL